MPDEKDIETENSLIRVNRVCKWISGLMKIIFILLCIWWAVSIAVMIFTMASADSFNSANFVSVSGVILYVLHALIIAAICVTLIRIFSDAAKGLSPFTMSQVGRLRIISGMLLLYAVLEFVITLNSSVLRLGWLSAQAGAMAEGIAILAIDVAPIIAAAVVFAFSFVFKYGVLLQEFSDESV